MTQAVDVIEDAGTEAAFRDALVDKLLTGRMITTSAVESAFRRVPERGSPPRALRWNSSTTPTTR